jgi:protocatechuate 3,4-dioxygenase beta subunit
VSDDRTRGLARREILVLAGASAAVVAYGPERALRWVGRTCAPVPDAAAQTAPACIVRPAQTEGPYFVDERLNRSDIRTDPDTGEPSEGTPLVLTFAVSRIDGASCLPLAGALVDVWHCDAAGVYSDVAGAVGLKFLRGYQVTDAAGAATFTTIYPGWYPGRTVHVHFKIRTDPDADDGFEFTSQVYFDDALTDVVFAGAPYAARGECSTRNADDAIYQSGGGELLLDVTDDGGGHAATFAIGLDLPSTVCSTVGACLATLASTLPTPASAATGGARRTARALRKRFAKASKLLARAESGSAARRAKRRARARDLLEALVAESRAADARGTLGVSLPAIEAATAAVLALVP